MHLYRYMTTNVPYTKPEVERAIMYGLPMAHPHNVTQAIFGEMTWEEDEKERWFRRQSQMF